jgi:hypothetical protein
LNWEFHNEVGNEVGNGVGNEIGINGKQSIIPQTSTNGILQALPPKYDQYYKYNQMKRRFEMEMKKKMNR